jgi:very-short-patch-repair endonuclease
MDWQDLARQQAGVVAHRQLASSGLTQRQIDGLVGRADLTELLPAVYSPRPVPGSALQRDWAAILWSRGVLSHRSAARLWRLPVPESGIPHVTVDDRRFRGHIARVRVHRVRIGDSDTTTFGGLPVTNRPRTVVDLMRTERHVIARDLRDRALQQRWLDERVIRHSISAQLGRTGNTQLRRLLAELEHGAQAESERKLHAILRRAGISGWRPQYRVRVGSRTADIDVALPEHKIAIEVDGRRHHDGAADRFEDDRDRQNLLIAAGWRVLRFTWAMLTEDPDAVIGRIVQLLPP